MNDMRIGEDRGRGTGIALWLLACCALVFAIIVVGGVTRLTHSGLSIVEWQPIVGTMPPLNAGDWEVLFHKYQQTPEYLKVNHGMSIAEFKGIFWWEYFHRLLGRAIGLAFFVPFLFFLVRGRIDARLGWRLAGIFALGGLQGAMGWYMVSSGLIDNPRVSHLRLTAHLGLALLIYAAMLWIGLGLLRPVRARAMDKARRLSRYAGALSILIFVMALSGALVAGTHAGRAYNTFPLMNGRVVPAEIMMLEPWWLNAFNNMATVQFDHRAIAWLLMLLVPAFWFAAQRAGVTPRARLATHMLLGALALQTSLGIATLLLAVPVPLAAAHQAGAVVLLTVAIWTTHELRCAGSTQGLQMSPMASRLGAVGTNAARLI